MTSAWITGRAFVPTIGCEYEVTFGKVIYNGQTGDWTARIRADGLLPSQWIDLDTAAQLDPALAAYVVQAYREI